MDRQRNKKEKEVQRSMRRKNAFWRIIGYLREYFLIILVLVGVGAFMNWKHDGQVIQSVKDYWENFDNPNYANRGKEPAGHRQEIIVEGQTSQQTAVPVVDIQGDLVRDGEQYVIIKHNGKEYTIKTGESFDNGKYIVTGISKQEMEITDSNGNYFYYAIPNRQRIKK